MATGNLHIDDFYAKSLERFTQSRRLDDQTISDMSGWAYSLPGTVCESLSL